MARNNRSAGNSWEVTCVKFLKERNIYPHAVTSRFANRSRDHVDKIDICNDNEHTNGVMTDSIQCKTTISPINYKELLESMANIPGTRKVVWHRRTKKANKLFRVEACLAIMDINDHLDLLAHWKALQVLVSKLSLLPEDAQKEVKQQLTALGIPF